MYLGLPPEGCWLLAASSSVCDCYKGNQLHSICWSEVQKGYTITEGSHWGGRQVRCSHFKLGVLPCTSFHVIACLHLLQTSLVPLKKSLSVRACVRCVRACTCAQILPQMVKASPQGEGEDWLPCVLPQAQFSVLPSHAVCVMELYTLPRLHLKFKHIRMRIESARGWGDGGR